MSHKLIAKVAAVSLAMVVFTGAHYRGDRLSIDFPAGWSEPEKDSDGIVTAKEPGGATNCNVETKDIASIADMTLKEINDEFSHVFDAADWADFLGLKTPDVTVISSESNPFADAYFHVATLRVRVDGSEAMMRYGFYLLPGRATIAGCYATVADFPNFAALFDQTIASLRPW